MKLFEVTYVTAIGTDKTVYEGNDIKKAMAAYESIADKNRSLWFANDEAIAIFEEYRK